METESNDSEDCEYQNHEELINYIQDSSESLLAPIIIKLVLDNENVTLTGSKFTNQFEMNLKSDRLTANFDAPNQKKYSKKSKGSSSLFYQYAIKDKVEDMD